MTPRPPLGVVAARLGRNTQARTRLSAPRAPVPPKKVIVATVRADGDWCLIVGNFPRQDYARLKEVREEIREILARPRPKPRRRKP